MQKKSLIVLILAAFLLFSFCFVVPRLVFANPDYEDWTTYTEVGDDISLVGTDHIDATLSRNRDAYLWKDFGDGYFTDFEHKIDVNLADLDNWATVGAYYLTNFVDDAKALSVILDTYIGVRIDDNGANFGVSIIFGNGDGRIDDTWWGGTLGTWYYLTIKRDGIALTCKIYSDSDRTDLIVTVDLEIPDDVTFRYAMNAVSWNDGASKTTDSDIENLLLQEEEEPIFVTFYLNDGGKFYVNATDTANSTSTEYENETVLVLMAVPASSSYIFVSFNWTASSSSSNPHEYTVLGNDTIWLLFDGAGGADEDYTDPADVAVILVGSLIFIPLLIIFLYIARRKR